jgi:hypothetical protein
MFQFPNNIDHRSRHFDHGLYCGVPLYDRELSDFKIKETIEAVKSNKIKDLVVLTHNNQVYLVVNTRMSLGMPYSMEKFTELWNDFNAICKNVENEWLAAKYFTRLWDTPKFEVIYLERV